MTNQIETLFTLTQPEQDLSAAELVSYLEGMCDVPEEAIIAVITQILRPNGEKRRALALLPHNLKPVMIDMVAHGCGITVWLTVDGRVRIAITHGEHLVDSLLADNNEDVVKGMIELLLRVGWNDETITLSE